MQAVEPGTCILGEYRDTAWMCRDGIRKAKAQLELKLGRDVKNHKSFYRYTVQERHGPVRRPKSGQRAGTLLL